MRYVLYTMYYALCTMYYVLCDMYYIHNPPPTTHHAPPPHTHTQTTQDYVYSLINGGGRNVWLGLNDVNSEGTWVCQVGVICHCHRIT
jgi:hypothetical protein